MIKKIILFAFFCLLICLNAFGEDNHKVFTFEEAKKLLYTEVPFQNDFYCGCPFKDGTIDFVKCAFRDPKHSSRSSRVEAEHVVPADWFGKTFIINKSTDCKKLPRRECLLRLSPEFKKIHDDMHNLMPTVGSANGARSNFTYCELPSSTPDLYPGCDFKRDNGVCVQPRKDIRGDIARVMWYMEQEYPEHVKIPKPLQSLLKKWSVEDPVDWRECEIDSAIAKIQGNHNSFVQAGCKKYDAAFSNEKLEPQDPKKT